MSSCGVADGSVLVDVAEEIDGSPEILCDATTPVLARRHMAGIIDFF